MFLTLFLDGPSKAVNPQFWPCFLKTTNSFHSCYSQSPLHLCLEISISSNSCNLLQFLQFVTLHCKGGTPNRKPYPLSDGLRNPYRNLKSESSQDYAKKPQQIVRSWIRLQEYRLRYEVGFPNETIFFSWEKIEKTLPLSPVFMLLSLTFLDS
jgi:hypothetical protein